MINVIVEPALLLGAIFAIVIIFIIKWYTNFNLISYFGILDFLEMEIAFNQIGERVR